MTARAQSLVQAYLSAGLKLTTAESCTGGMIAAAITDVPGSSSIFERGYVTYSNAAKTEMLNVPPALFDSVGAVSIEVAQAMADGSLLAAGADVAVSVTGIAGPGGSEFKPEGRVCFGLAQSGKGTQTHQIDFGALGRDNVRQASVDYALELLASALP